MKKIELLAHWSVGPGDSGSYPGEFEIDDDNYELLKHYVLDEGITDIYDIMKITDIMITDYSSIGQEFSYYLKRPVLLYAKDMDEFQNDRGMYYKIQDLPYPIAENNDQLISLVKTYSFSNDNADLNAFFNEAGFVGNGNTSKEVAEYIISYLQI